MKEQLRQLVTAFASFQEKMEGAINSVEGEMKAGQESVKEEMKVGQVSVKEEMRAVKASQEEMKKEITCIIENKFEATEGRIGAVENKVSSVKEQIAERVSAVEQQIDYRVSSVKEQVEERVTAMEQQINDKVSAAVAKEVDALKKCIATAGSNNSEEYWVEEKPKTTSNSPFQMFIDHDLRLPCDFLSDRPVDAPSSPEEYIQDVQARFKVKHRSARKRVNLAASKMKTRYDTRATGHRSNEGDKVWLWSPTRRNRLSPKLQSPWDSPYTVLNRLNDVAVRIQVDLCCVITRHDNKEYYRYSVSLTDHLKHGYVS
ncbi:hypothetical protein X975_05746, partial [Stegodyphus mimosarum]